MTFTRGLWLPRDHGCYAHLVSDSSERAARRRAQWEGEVIRLGTPKSRHSCLDPAGHIEARVSDTSPEAEAILLQRIRAMSPSQRFEEGVRLCMTARAFMRSGIRHRHPEYSAEEIEEALARLLWGDDLYQKAKPGKPLLAP
jgi:hypothetical protein